MWDAYQKLLLLDYDGIHKVRQWNYFATLISNLDKDIVILDSIVTKIITSHLENINHLEEY